MAGTSGDQLVSAAIETIATRGNTTGVAAAELWACLSHSEELQRAAVSPVGASSVEKQGEGVEMGDGVNLVPSIARDVGLRDYLWERLRADARIGFHQPVPASARPPASDAVARGETVSERARATMSWREAADMGVKLIAADSVLSSTLGFSSSDEPVGLRRKLLDFIASRGKNGVLSGDLYVRFQDQAKSAQLSYHLQRLVTDGLIKKNLQAVRSASTAQNLFVLARLSGQQEQGSQLAEIDAVASLALDDPDGFVSFSTAQAALELSPSAVDRLRDVVEDYAARGRGVLGLVESSPRGAGFSLMSGSYYSARGVAAHVGARYDEQGTGFLDALTSEQQIYRMICLAGDDGVGTAELQAALGLPVRSLRILLDRLQEECGVASQKTSAGRQHTLRYFRDKSLMAHKGTSKSSIAAGSAVSHWWKSPFERPSMHSREKPGWEDVITVGAAAWERGTTSVASTAAKMRRSHSKKKPVRSLDVAIREHLQGALQRVGAVPLECAVSFVRRQLKRPEDDASLTKLVDDQIAVLVHSSEATLHTVRAGAGAGAGSGISGAHQEVRVLARSGMSSNSSAVLECVHGWSAVGREPLRWLLTHGLSSGVGGATTSPKERTQRQRTAETDGGASSSDFVPDDGGSELSAASVELLDEAAEEIEAVAEDEDFEDVIVSTSEDSDRPAKKRGRGQRRRSSPRRPSKRVRGESSSWDKLPLRQRGVLPSRLVTFAPLSHDIADWSAAVDEELVLQFVASVLQRPGAPPDWNEIGRAVWRRPEACSARLATLLAAPTAESQLERLARGVANAESDPGAVDAAVSAVKDGRRMLLEYSRSETAVDGGVDWTEPLLDAVQSRAVRVVLQAVLCKTEAPAKAVLQIVDDADVRYAVEWLCRRNICSVPASVLKSTSTPLAVVRAARRNARQTWTALVAAATRGPNLSLLSDDDAVKVLVNGTSDGRGAEVAASAGSSDAATIMIDTTAAEGVEVPFSEDLEELSEERIDCIFAAEAEGVVRLSPEITDVERYADERFVAEYALEVPLASEPVKPVPNAGILTALLDHDAARKSFIASKELAQPPAKAAVARADNSKTAPDMVPWQATRITLLQDRTDGEVPPTLTAEVDAPPPSPRLWTRTTAKGAAESRKELLRATAAQFVWLNPGVSAASVARALGVIDTVEVTELLAHMVEQGLLRTQQVVRRARSLAAATAAPVEDAAYFAKPSTLAHPSVVGVLASRLP